MKIKSIKAFALLCVLLISDQVFTENKYQEKSIENVNYEAQENFNPSINNTIYPNPDNLHAEDNLNKTIIIGEGLEKANKINDIVSVSKNSSINSINNPNSNNGMKHHSFEINFFNSFFRSFSLLLISEVMDKSFIIILYFSTKLPPTKVLFFSGISLVFMNSISIIIGYSLPSLLYRTLIEWIALISFIFLSFAYVNEAYHLEDESHEKKFTKTIKNEKRSKLLEKKTSLKNIKLSNSLNFL